MHSSFTATGIMQGQAQVPKTRTRVARMGKKVFDTPPRGHSRRELELVVGHQVAREGQGLGQGIFLDSFPFGLSRDTLEVESS